MGMRLFLVSESINMVIAHLTGGLGNQLFEYAAARSLALRLRTDLFFDTRYYLLVRNRTYRLDNYAVNGKKMDIADYMRYFLRQKSFRIHKEKKYFAFDKTFSRLAGNVYLDGWWQNPAYFRPQWDVI